MSDYKRIENFDTIILDQISEEQVAAWMAAKLCIMRKTLPLTDKPPSTYNTKVTFRKGIVTGKQIGRAHV